MSTRGFTVSTDFPGANAIVEDISNDTICLRQDPRDTTTWWFYWALRLQQAGGRTLTFRFSDGDVCTALGPAVSFDAGATWDWLGREGDQPEFTVEVPPQAADVRLALAPPYTQADLERFLIAQGSTEFVRRSVLCTSRKGRAVELLELGAEPATAAFRLALTCRHHACEMQANRVLEGFLASVLAGDALGDWYRRNVALFVVPFVDKDGVEDGDQGKNRAPRDHNRDYIGDPVYPETAAIRAQLPAWAGTLDVALDLHCPWIRGAGNETIYFVGQQDPTIWEATVALSTTLEQGVEGRLPYAAANNLPFGKGWNTAGNFQQGMSFGRWSQGLVTRLGGGLEFPYAVADGVPVTAAGAREFGRDLARALKRFLTDG